MVSKENITNWRKLLGCRVVDRESRMRSRRIEPGAEQ